MTTLKRTPSDYRSLLRYSHHRHLLVEGRDDKRAFALFLDELFEQTASPSIERVCIDSAEDLIEFDKAGNREKVEIVCQSVSGEPYAGKIVGFVDREFRKFDRDPRLVDRIAGHRVSDRLVWSRGHSIENYYFDFDTLRSPLREFSVTDRFRDALDLFEAVFEKTIRLACAASLTGDEVERPTLVKGSVSQEIFQIGSNGKAMLTVDSDTWGSSLTEHLRATRDMTNQLIGRFQFWSKCVQEADLHVIRWMCHGHIGLAFIWAVYSRCVFEVCQRQGYEEKDARAEARKVLKAEESVRFNACAARWVERALGGHCSYPLQVFKLLGLNVPDSQ